MASWITEEAARLVEQWERANWPDHGPLGLAESCLRSGDDHGYRRGLLEAARRLEAQEIGCFHQSVEGDSACFTWNDRSKDARRYAAELRALADARADSGQETDDAPRN